MTGPDLLIALLAGESPHALAARLGKKNLQSTIWKFTNGVAKEPRRASLQPLADHFGIPVAAFYEPELAIQVAQEKGLDVKAPPPRSTTKPASEADRVRQALELIATASQRATEHRREDVANSLSKLVRHPELIHEISDDICRWLKLPTHAHEAPAYPADSTITVHTTTPESLRRHGNNSQDSAGGEKP